MAKFFNAVILTGGVEGCLDGIDGNLLTVGDCALTVVAGELSAYQVTEEGTPPDESLPDVIEPDVNPGNKRWELVVTAGEGGGVTPDPQTHIYVQDGVGQYWNENQGQIVLHSDIEWDTLGEYDAVTGTFTPQYAGWYRIHFFTSFHSSEWLQSDYIDIEWQNAAATEYCYLLRKYGDGLTMPHDLMCSGVAYMNVGDVARVYLFSGFIGGIETLDHPKGGGTFIDRIG